MIQSFGQGKTYLQALLERKPAVECQLALEGLRQIAFGMKNTFREFCNVSSCINSLRTVGDLLNFRCRVIRELHHIKEITGRLISSHGQNAHLAGMSAGNRLKLLDAGQLSLKR